MKTVKFFVALTVVAILAVGFQACQQNILVSEEYQDSEFLEIRSETFSTLTESEASVVFEAMSRMNVSSVDGYYHVGVSCGREVNISEGLFKLIKDSYEHTNESKRLGRGGIRIDNGKISIVRLKTGSAEEGDGASSDCVAHALAGMGDADYEAAKQYIEDNYGTNGVPADKLAEIVKHFYPDAKEGTAEDLNSSNVSNAFIWYQVNDTTGHAVNGMLYDINSGNLIYNDGQNGSTNTIKSDSIQSIFYF